VGAGVGPGQPRPATGRPHHVDGPVGSHDAAARHRHAPPAVELLAGRPGKAAPDAGPIVCACFGVGKKTLEQAIAQGAASVEALGIRLKAGTNCGSCLPELKALLAAERVS